MAEKGKALMKWQEAQKAAAANLKSEAGEDMKFNISPFTKFAQNLMYGRNTKNSRIVALATAKPKKTALKATVKRSSGEKKLSREEKQKILREAGIAPNAITLARFTTLRKERGNNATALNALRAEKEAKKFAKALAGPKPLTAAQMFAAEQKAAREAFKAAQIAEREAIKAARATARTRDSTIDTEANLEKCYQKCRDIQAKKAVERGTKVAEKEAKKAEEAVAYEAAREAMPSANLHESLLNKLTNNGINVGKIRENTSRMNTFKRNPIVSKWKKLSRKNKAEANFYYDEKVLPTFEGYAKQVKGPKGGSRRRSNKRRNMTRRRRN